MLPNFWILAFVFILFTLYFSMIECRYNVIDLSIFVIYDVQYVVTTYGSKTNWIYVFINHKWTTPILNALVLIFF